MVIVIGRIVFIVAMVVAMAAITVIELAVALNLEITHALVQKAMLAGSLLWTAVVFRGWADKNPSPSWLMAILTLFAAGSIAGVCNIPTFVSFALWANVGLWVLSLAIMARMLPLVWKQYALIPAS